MPDKIKVAILDDHQAILDGYLHRLGADPRIEGRSEPRKGTSIQIAWKSKG